jgi:hypothetical protein
LDKLVIALVASLLTHAAAAQAPRCEDCQSRRREQALEFLRQYDDPAQRQLLREDARARARKANQEFARQRNLDAEQFRRVVEAITDYDLATRVVHERCNADPACRRPTGFEGMWDRREQELLSVLGEDGLRAMHAAVRLELDKRFLRAFSARLPTHDPLTDAQLTALLTTLKALHDSTVKDFLASHQDFMPYGDCSTLMVLFLNTPPLEARMASARTYVQRAHSRSAVILDDEQLAEFDRMQEELLSDLRRFLVEQDAEKRAARVAL